jgi:hypothetical protein
LVQDGHFLGDGISRFLHLLVQGSVAHIGERPEGRQMVFLVPESEATQDLIVGTRIDFLFSVVPQEDPQIAARWSVIRNEIRSRQAHGGGHSITPGQLQQKDRT